MNKNRYRIVYNKARNQMMAVAENTTSQGKGQQSGSGQPHAPAMQRGAKVIELFQLRPLAFAALCLFGLQPVLLQAEVIADKNAATNNRPLIDTTANNLPLVQITTPSAAGVSRNQYSQFNVDPGGVILNNSQVNVLTQQGGYVGGNPYLANGSARIILNEVTGTGASSLRGYTEVAGQRAEVIIANPNGIVCDGCGFINTSRGILTTGVPMMGSGGSLDSFRVTGGQIQIGAGGLNASNIDQLDLITRSLKVNGEIWANNLNAVIGANQVDYTTLGVQVIAGDANKPTVGIDVALLGGMYANKIRLVGTEAGVGVNSLGTIAAQAGDFTLDNRGNVTLNGHTSSSANLVITTQGDLANSGTLEGSNISSNSAAFNNSGIVQADVLTLNAASLNNLNVDARIVATTSTNMVVTGDINNIGSLASANLTTSSNGFNNTGSVQADVLTLHATSLNNLGADAKITANTSANLAVTGDISNEGTLSGGALTTSSNAFKNTGNVLAGVLAIDASSLKNLGSQAKIVGNNSVNLTVAGDINNEGTLAGATFTTTSNAFNNSGAVLANELTLNAGSLNNQGATSTIAGNTSVDLNVSGNIDNAGTITAGTLTSTSNAFTNTGGVFGDVVTLNANSLYNQGTTSIMAGNSSLVLNITGDINNVGTLDGNTVTTHSQTFNNTGGVFGDVVTVNATNLNNTGEPAIIAATHALNLYISDTLNNTGGANLYSMGELNAGASSTRDADGYLLDNMKVFNNVSSTVQAEGNISVSADQIINKRTYVQVDSTTVPGQNVKTVTSDKHEVLSTIDNVINPDGTVTIGSITTADTHTVAQVQGVSEVLSKTSETRTVTVQPYPDLNPDSYDYYTNLSAYNSIVTPTYSTSSSCQPCYSHTFTTESVNATTKPQSNLLAGGSMHFKGAINNEYSTIAAGQNITFNANGPHTFTSGEYITPDPLLSGAVLVSANGYTQLSHVVVKTEIQDGKQDNWYSTVAEHCGYNPFHYCNYDVTWHNDQLDYKPAPITTPLDFTSLSASFTAGKSITGSANIVSNLNTNATEVSTTLGALQSSTASALQTSATPLLNITLPKNGLFKYNTAPGQAYLIETNPRFASYREFISSDYMLSRLTLDPQQIQKRLGDGFYEQKLVSDQITNLTGRRFLSEISSAEEEFKLLMEQGIAEAHTQNLIPGVALTTAQVAALTHDIVWMVAQEVSLPDGKKEKLLVPQVFLTRLHANDLRPNGSLIAAENINLKVSGTLQNSGTILGSKNTSLSATDVVNQSGTISSIGDTVIVASNDIKNLSGTISGRRLGILAGHDIVNDTEMEALQLGNVLTTRIHNTASIAATESIDMRAGHDVTVTAAKVVSGGSATLGAGNNLTINARTATETAGLAQNANNAATNPDGTPNLLTALRIFSQGESGASGGISTQTNLLSQIQTGTDLTLSAHNDIKLTAAQIYAQENLTIAAQNITLDAVKDVKQFSFNDHHNLNTSRYDEKVIGSTLQAGGNVTLAATSLQKNSSGEHGNDGNSGDNINAVHTGGNGNISLEGALINSKNGNFSLIADADIKIGTVDEKHESFTETHSSSSDVFTSTERTTRNQSWRTDAIGSNLSGNNVSITSGHDINIAGSDIAANKDITLAAMNDINIAAATHTYGSENYSHEQTSGWQITSDFNITNKGPEITRKAREDGTKQSYSRSNLTSKTGNLKIMAGGNLVASGTDLSAKAGDLALTAGGTVALLAGQDTLSQQSSTQVVTNTNLISQQRRTITDSYDSLTYQGSTAQGKKVTVSSGAGAILQAAQITAGEGGLNLDGGRDIKLLAAVNSSSSKHTEKLETDGVLFGFAGNLDAVSDRSKVSKTEKQQKTAQVSQLRSAADITTHSAGDTLIEASVLEAKGAIDLTAGNEATYNQDGSIKTAATVGKLIIAAVKDSDYFAEEDKHSSRSWQSQSGSGHYTETIKLANIKAGKGLSTNATGGIVIDIPDVPAAPPVVVVQPDPTAAETSYDEHGNPQEKPKPTPEQEAAKAAAAAVQAAAAAAQKKHDDEQRYNDQINTLAQKTGQEWIGQLTKLAKDKPDSVKIQQVAAAAQHWDYKAEGLTPEGAAVVVIAVTYFTAGAASGAATTMTGAAVGTTTVASAAIAAGLTTLATQAAVTIINNKGDVGKTLEDMGKSENIRAVVTAMVTAGALQSLSNVSFLKNIEGYNAKSTFINQLQKNVINNTASALVNHAINGGDLQQQLEQSLKSAFIDTGAAQGANWIGDMKDNDTLNTYTHKLAHAIAGCAAGVARSNDCGSGALGAVVGEISAELYGGNRSNTSNIDRTEFKTDTVNFAKLMSGVAAAITGKDVNLAAAAGGNAAENNYLSHKENEDRLEAARGCANGNTEACDKRDVLNALDKELDAKLNLACQGNTNSDGCVGATVSMRKQLDTYFQTENGVQLKDNLLSVEELNAGLGEYTAKAELQSYVDLLKVSNHQALEVQSDGKLAKLPDTYDSDPYGVLNPKNSDSYMVVKVGGQWGAVGKSEKVYTNVAGVNGILNETNYAPGLMGSHVERKFETSSLYTLYYNPTKGILSDGWETFMDKLGFTTPVTKQFSQVLSDVQAGDRSVSWVAHSQGGPIFAEAVNFNGGNLSKNSVAFDSGANNKWVTNYYLQKAGINSGKETIYNNSPFDFVPNVIGLNGNILEMLGSTVAIPLLFMGPAVSPHTLPYIPAQPSTLSQAVTP